MSEIVRVPPVRDSKLQANHPALISVKLLSGIGAALKRRVEWGANTELNRKALRAAIDAVGKVPALFGSAAQQVETAVRAAAQVSGVSEGGIHFKILRPESVLNANRDASADVVVSTEAPIGDDDLGVKKLKLPPKTDTQRLSQYDRFLAALTEGERQILADFSRIPQEEFKNLIRLARLTDREYVDADEEGNINDCPGAADVRAAGKRAVDLVTALAPIIAKYPRTTDEEPTQTEAVKETNVQELSTHVKAALIAASLLEPLSQIGFKAVDNNLLYDLLAGWSAALEREIKGRLKTLSGPITGIREFTERDFYSTDGEVVNLSQLGDQVELILQFARVIGEVVGEDQRETESEKITKNNQMRVIAAYAHAQSNPSLLAAYRSRHGMTGSLPADSLARALVDVEAKRLRADAGEESLRYVRQLLSAVASEEGGLARLVDRWDSIPFTNNLRELFGREILEDLKVFLRTYAVEFQNLTDDLAKKQGEEERVRAEREVAAEPAAVPTPELSSEPLAAPILPPLDLGMFRTAVGASVDQLVITVEELGLARRSPDEAQHLADKLSELSNMYGDWFALWSRRVNWNGESDISQLSGRLDNLSSHYLRFLSDVIARAGTHANDNIRENKAFIGSLASAVWLEGFKIHGRHEQIEWVGSIQARVLNVFSQALGITKDDPQQMFVRRAIEENLGAAFGILADMALLRTLTDAPQMYSRLGSKQYREVGPSVDKLLNQGVGSICLPLPIKLVALD